MEKTLISPSDLANITSSALTYLVNSTNKPCLQIIPGSKTVASPSNSAEFGEAYSKLRLRQQDACVICYDQSGIEGAARLWWYLKAAAYTNVKILDGGLKLWETEAGEVEDYDADTENSEGTREFTLDYTKFTSQREVSLLSSDFSQLLVATSNNELTKGLLDNEGKVKSLRSLKEHFNAVKVRTDNSVSTVVSGELAGTLLLALHLLGVEQLSYLQVEGDLSLEASQSVKTNFYSIEEPMSSYLDCISESFKSQTEELERSPCMPIEYKTVNVKITQPEPEPNQGDAQQKNCLCIVQ